MVNTLLEYSTIMLLKSGHALIMKENNVHLARPEKQFSSVLDNRRISQEGVKMMKDLGI